MKKINSIGYGGKVIGIGLLFLIGIPGLLSVVNRFAGAPALQALLYVSMGIGGAIEVGFLCVLLAELRQDRIINAHYARNPVSALTPQQILDARQKRHSRR